MKLFGLDLFTKKEPKATLPSVSYTSPVWVWRIILVSTALAMVGIAIIDGIVFYKVSNDTFIETGTAGVRRTELINQPKLDHVLDLFDQRAKRQATIIATPPSIIDPSR